MKVWVFNLYVYSYLDIVFKISYDCVIKCKFFIIGSNNFIGNMVFVEICL